MQETAIKSLENKFPAFYQKFSNDIVDVVDMRGILSAQIKPESVKELIRFLKEQNTPRFEMMMDLFGMDYLKYEPEQPERFAVVYNLYSVTAHEHLFLKAFLPENKPEIDSLCDVYKAANWFEREAWDLFGIRFKGHPNLTRILCHNDFVGHPLRKDYPADRYQRLKAAVTSEGLS